MGSFRRSFIHIILVTSKYILIVKGKRLSGRRKCLYENIDMLEWLLQLPKKSALVMTGSVSGLDERYIYFYCFEEG